MKLLLDTHVFLWRAGEPHRLSARANAAIDDPSNELWFSAASAWEIATKHRLGKLPGGAAIVGSLAEQVRVLRALPLPISLEHGLAAGTFSAEHRDPFDRMLAAQAMIEGAAMITADRAFDGFPVTIVW